MSTPATTARKNVAVHNDNQLARFENFTVSGCILAGDTGTLPLLAAKTAHQYYIRRIEVFVIVASTPTAIFRATTTTAFILFELFGSGATPAMTTGRSGIDYGKLGIALPDGEGLELVLSAANNSFTFIVEGYRTTRPQSSGVLTPDQAIP